MTARIVVTPTTVAIVRTAGNVTTRRTWYVWRIVGAAIRSAVTR